MKYLSRKFLICVGLIVLIIANNKFNLGLPIDNDSVMAAIILLALGYLGVEGTVDIIKEIKK